MPTTSEHKTSKNMPFRSLLTGILLAGGALLSIFSPVRAADPVAALAPASALPLFSQSGLEGWEEEEFSGQTSYRLTELDGRKVLLAESRQAASALYYRVQVDIEQTPWLNWSWRVEQRLPPLAETSKEGDDYSARIYVVVDGGLFFWKTIALNYVWSSAQKVGSVWPNAFAGKNAMLMALRSSEDRLGVWHTEKRDLREDFRQLFGREIRQIDLVAIMSDTDNSKGKTRAYYGDIYFTAD